MECCGLSENKISLLQCLFAKYEDIEQVLLYGSRAKGNYDKFSDVDITLVGDKLTPQILTKVMLDIDDLLLPYTFDISIFHKITNPDVVDHIKRVGKGLYNRSKYLNKAKKQVCQLVGQ